MGPKVTVVVPFVRVNPLVVQCIEACLAVRYDHLALVLLPDVAPAPGTIPSDPRMTVVPTGAVRIAVKRNIGIAQAQDAHYIAFIDSDAYPDGEWLTHAIAAFDRLPPEVMAVGGPNLSPPSEPIGARSVGFASQSFLIGGVRAYRKRRSHSRFSLDLPTCNLIVRRAVFERIGGFDPALVTGEDLDLCSRMITHGYRIYYERNVVVYHHNRPLCLPFFLQRFTYGCCVWEFLSRNPSWRNAYVLLPLGAVLFFLLGPLLGRWVPGFSRLYWCGVIAFGGTVLLEAIRWAPLSAMVPTLTALVIGNLAPGLGTLSRLLRIPIDRRRIYRNWRPPGDRAGVAH